MRARGIYVDAGLVERLGLVALVALALSVVAAAAALLVEALARRRAGRRAAS